MSNYTNLKNAIQSVIKANGNNEITGPILQSELLSMIITLGAGYQYMGVAQPSTNPGTPDARVMYLAYLPGTYVNFGGLTVTGFCVLKYATSWTKEDIPISGGGSANFLTEPDDLTLETVGNTQVLKFANRQYNNNTPNGLGYKILRGDSTFDEQVTDANTIYEIRYDFDLNAGNINLPENSILKFDGGSLKNGTITGNNTIIEASPHKIFTNITIAGTWNVNRILSKWFDGNSIENCLLMNNSDLNTEIIIDGSYSLQVSIASTSGLKINDNTIVRLSGTITKSSESTAISSMFTCGNNVTIIGGIIDGNKTNFDTANEYGHGIELLSSRGVILSGVEIRNCRGDGIYISGKETGASVGVIIENCNIHDCRRNGVSIIYGKELTIIGTTIYNIAGTSPQAAIDIEPNYSYQINEKISIIDCALSDCRQGILFIGANGTVKDCLVCNTSFTTTIFSSALTFSSAKNIIFEHSHFYLSGKTSSYAISGNGDNIIFNGCTFVQNDERVSSRPYYLDLKASFINCTFNIKDYLAQILASDFTNCEIECSSFCVNCTVSGVKIEGCKITCGNFIFTPTSNTAYAENVFFLNNVVDCVANYYPFNSSRLKNSRITGNKLNLKSTIGRNLMNFIGANNVVISDNSIVIGSNNNVIVFDSTSVDCQANNNIFEVADGITHTLSTYVGINTKTARANRIGDKFFFQADGKEYIYNGTTWLTADGYAYNLARKGTTANRPSLTAGDSGFTYFDTTIGKMIVWSGSAWVNMDGSAI